MMPSPRCMVFQYFSDLHTEHFSEDDFAAFVDALRPNAPYLILPGDIGHPDSTMYHRTLAHTSRLFKRT